MSTFYGKMNLRGGPVTADTKENDKFMVIKLLYQKLLTTPPFDSLIACGLNYKPNMDTKEYDEKAVRIMQEFLKRSFLKDDSAAKKAGVDVSSITGTSMLDTSGQFNLGTAKALSYYFWVLEGRQGQFKTP
jgi:hypothetical protein